MNTVNVRIITYDDYQSVRDLLAELGRPTVPESKNDATKIVYNAHVENPSTFSLLAERDGQAIGFLSLELRERLNWDTLEAWIPDFIVTEAARGTGAGHALFDRAVAIARENNCHRLVLESGYVREVAHQFYTNHGMRNAGYYFTLKPDQYE